MDFSDLDNDFRNDFWKEEISFEKKMNKFSWVIGLIIIGVIFWGLYFLFDVVTSFVASIIAGTFLTHYLKTEIELSNNKKIREALKKSHPEYFELLPIEQKFNASKYMIKNQFLLSMRYEDYKSGYKLARPLSSIKPSIDEIDHEYEMLVGSFRKLNPNKTVKLSKLYREFVRSGLNNIDEAKDLVGDLDFAAAIYNYHTLATYYDDKTSIRINEYHGISSDKEKLPEILESKYDEYRKYLDFTTEIMLGIENRKKTLLSLLDS